MKRKINEEINTNKESQDQAKENPQGEGQKPREDRSTSDKDKKHTFKKPETPKSWLYNPPRHPPRGPWPPGGGGVTQDDP